MVIVGIDVAKATLESAVWTPAVPPVVTPTVQALGSVPNTVDGWQQLALRLVERVGAPAASAVTIVLEPTGGYEVGVALWALAQPGWQVLRPNPHQVRAWARSQGRRAKTDQQDAQVLAQYGAQTPPPGAPWQPLPTEVSDLEQLLHQRDDLEELLQRERSRQRLLQARPDIPAAVHESVARLIAALDQERATVEEAIATHVAQHPPLAQTRARLLSVPGVGARNVLPMLVTLTRWQTLTGGRGSPKGLVAFVGLDPQPYQSGTSVHRRATISRHGNPQLRRRLYMGALGGTRGDNAVRAFYRRLVERGKPKKVALVAAARKILLWAWAVFHSGVPFDTTKATAHAA